MEVDATNEPLPETSDAVAPSLCIPISSSTSNQFIEIFPEEISTIQSSQLSTVLQDEKAPLKLWTDAATLYMTHKKERDSTSLLSTACEELLSKQNLGNKEERTRIFAATGIAYLTQANKSGTLNDNGLSVHSTSALDEQDRTARQREASEYNTELRDLAEKHFSRSWNLTQLFPMTWIGRGMLNLSLQRTEKAKFFFKTTLKHCGMVLPALLGMACVHFKEGNYHDCLDMYSKAITLFPDKAGASARVGLGLACYQLGQVDRAKSAFQRAHAMDPENVEAMVGIAVLDVASLDETLSRDKDYRKMAENAMRLISMANLIDHSNAMVQNHLANYYFNKWTPVTGVTVKMEEGKAVVVGSGPINLDAGERIRIGYQFETNIVEEDDGDMMDDDSNTFKIKDAWKDTSTEGLKLWKKDYDRVIALAKGAYSSTTVQGIQAESLYILARVHHVRDEMEKANTFYERAVKIAPNLGPARFGLAQTLIWDETYDDAVCHLRFVASASPSATEAHATLGLLEVKSGKDRKGAFSYIKKAIDLDPANADLVLLEALALQQQESDYPQALERYQTAIELMDSQGEHPSWIVLTNMGVLCHETKKFDEAFSCYGKAVVALERDEDTSLKASLDVEHDSIQHIDNNLFWDYLDSGLEINQISTDESKTTWTIEGECPHVKVGDHVRLGDVFNSEIVEINGAELKLKDTHISQASEETNDEEGKQEPESPKMKLAVKRSNGRLGIYSAISIAFNLARLHETKGRTIAAVELHKAIVKRHPSYVNSYLRLACIARDCGSLANCSEWLKSACAVAPGNPEVLTLVGNLHLSLCDWKPAQSVFNQLLEQKIPKVEAYSMLCLGNIYFNNLKTPDRYAKHLQYAADFYRRILNKDNANAFAANGLGTVMAEKADLPRAKEIFNKVREVSGDSIPDALLNLGHIYLALSKHPEALQMYQSYMERTRNSDTPTSSKSQDEDEAEVLLYIAFAYFDWARQNEACNNAKAAPADDRYKKCIEYIEIALNKTKRENLVLRYNWCMAKLAAANCVLQKLTRGIRRTAQEVQDALDGLQESLPKVQMMLQWKQEGKKVPVSSSLMNNFVAQCKANIESAKSHLSEEVKKESEARELRELQKMDAMAKQKEKELVQLEAQERTAKEQEENEKKARMKMDKVGVLLESWEQEQSMAQTSEKKKKKRGKMSDAPQAEDDDDDEVDPNKSLFDDDSDEEDNADEHTNEVAKDESEAPAPESQPPQTEKELFGDSDDDDDDDKVAKDAEAAPAPAPSGKDLFGDDDSSSDEELVPVNKRGNDEVDDSNKDDDAAPQKKRRVEDDDNGSDE